MFKLTSKLALSNLVKNRSLYYPFALATVLATAILYSFVSLAYSPNMETSYGGTAARMTLQFGIHVIQIAVLILITYANSFVMKNRSRELGVYSLLGMEKKHLAKILFFESLYLWAASLGIGILLGEGKCYSEAMDILAGVTLESLVVARRVAKAIYRKAELGQVSLQEFPMLVHANDVLDNGKDAELPWEKFTFDHTAN